MAVTEPVTDRDRCDWMALIALGIYLAFKAVAVWVILRD